MPYWCSTGHSTLMHRWCMISFYLFATGNFAYRRLAMTDHHLEAMPRLLLRLWLVLLLTLMVDLGEAVEIITQKPEGQHGENMTKWIEFPACVHVYLIWWTHKRFPYRVNLLNYIIAFLKHCNLLTFFKLFV